MATRDDILGHIATIESLLSQVKDSTLRAKLNQEVIILKQLVSALTSL